MSRTPALVLVLAALPGGLGAGCSGARGGDARPAPPAALVRYVTGNDADATAHPTGPGLLLMGGGADVDLAFDWARSFASGGDVVILRTSGSDGYNDYLYETIGGFDSVETLLVTTRELADSEYVAWTIAHAELVFLAGGDQWTYLAAWKDTGVQHALAAAWERGAILGGTSAGTAVLGEFIFGARNGSVTSAEALADPFDARVALEREFLALPPLAGIVTDTHFAERDRMGRLVAFVARLTEDGWAAAPTGLGVDEGTALVVGPDGTAEVLGTGAVYVVRGSGRPVVCEPGQPLRADANVRRLDPGATFAFPVPPGSVAEYLVSASAGTLAPANPY